MVFQGAGMTRCDALPCHVVKFLTLEMITTTLEEEWFLGGTARWKGFEKSP